MSTAQYLSVIVPVHQKDLIKLKKQWYTRVLYNAYLPFHYSYILDTHVFPCYNNSYSELFRQFKSSNVDISISNRMNIKSIAGGAVLSKWGPRSHAFWLNNVRAMRKSNCYDDQSSLQKVLKKRNGYTFRMLSSNWFFASHGITQQGVFEGNGKCYRSSIVVNGPVHWAHGNPNDCLVMNGVNDEFTLMDRVYFRCKRCKCKREGAVAITSARELQMTVHPNRAPSLKWNNTKHSRTSIFW